MPIRHLRYTGICLFFLLTGCSHSAPDPHTHPTPTPANPDRIVMIQGSNEHSLAISREGKLFVAGSNRHGALGAGLTVQNITHFEEQKLFFQDDQLKCDQLVSSLLDDETHRTLTSFVIGHFRLGEPRLLSTGDNALGQQGWTDPSDIHDWQIHPFSHSITFHMISSSSTFSLLLDVGGNLWATGQRHLDGIAYDPYGDDQQVQSHADIIRQWTPIHVVQGTPPMPVYFQAAAAGIQHALLIDQTGHLWGAGDNRDCQLGIRCGIDQIIPQLTPIPVLNDQGESVRFIAIAVNRHSSIALDEHGSLWVVGRNINNNLGVFPTVLINQFTRVPITDSHGIHIPLKTISMSETGSLGISQDGYVYVSGKNHDAQQPTVNILGLPDTVLIVPAWQSVDIRNQNLQPVLFDSGFTTRKHSMLLDRNGHIWVTGENDQGQLGTGSMNNERHFRMLATFVR